MERAKRIVDAFPAREYQIELLSDASQLSGFIQRKAPTAVFLGYPWVKESIEKLTVTPGSFSYVYGSGIPAETRVRLLRQGIFRILPVIEGNEGILYKYLQMHLRQRKELIPRYLRAVTFADLRDLPLRDVLLNSVKERKNLIFKIEDGPWKAKMRVFQGKIIEALTPPLGGIDATISILNHPKGQVRLQGYNKEQEVCTFESSTLGAVAEADYESRIIRQFAEQFRSTNPAFLVADSAAGASLSGEERDLLKRVSAHRHFYDVLVNSPSGFLPTFRLLERLYQSGMLLFDSSEEERTGFTEEDISFLQKNLFPPETREGRLMVLGYPSSGKSEIIHKLAEACQSSVKKAKSVEFARLKLAPDLILNVFGISIDAYFQPIIQKLSDNMLAYIFVVDYSHRKNRDYLKYLYQQILAKYAVPSVVALTHAVGDPQKAAAEIRETLGTPPKIQIVPVNPSDFFQIRKLLYSLTKNT